MSAPLLPVFVKLEGRPSLVVGAGAVGLEKVRSLLECAAKVTVVAPDAREEIRVLAAEGAIRWRERRYQVEDIDGQQLVIAATSEPAVNHAVYEDAVAAGVLANAVDDPPFCDFYFGSVVRRGPLQIGISTAGESPGLAQRLRKELESLLDEHTGPWLERLGRLRREVLGVHPAGAARNELLRTLASREVCEAAHCPSRELALGVGSPKGLPYETTQASGQEATQTSWWIT